jgi:hypothetical protein
LMPLARQAYAAIARNRYSISRWLGAGKPEELAKELQRVPLESCATAQPNSKLNISEYLR